MEKKQFGAHLALLRKQRGFTQSELAAQLHVTDKAVSRWERGIGFPDITNLEPLANALSISLIELMKVESDSKDEELVDQSALQHTIAIAKAQKKQQSNKWIAALMVYLACKAGYTIFIDQTPMDYNGLPIIAVYLLYAIYIVCTGVMCFRAVSVR